MITYIFVHQQALGRNRKNGLTGPVEPPLRIMQQRKSQKAYRIEVSGVGTSEIFYTLDNSLKNGVRVYIQTELEVKSFENYCRLGQQSGVTQICVAKIDNLKREPEIPPIEVVNRKGQSRFTQRALIFGNFQIVYRHESESRRLLIEVPGLVRCTSV